LIQISDNAPLPRHSDPYNNATEPKMSHIPQALHEIFPDATDALQALKVDNAHFLSLADRFETLDEEVKQIEAGVDAASDDRLEHLKKHRLQVTDEIAAMVAAHTAN
jgi:uncharacterized protein YdcH (DUF465 family)